MTSLTYIFDNNADFVLDSALIWSGYYMSFYLFRYFGHKKKYSFLVAKFRL